jgi:phosphoribosylformylglycinamidine cyclo-ligase
MKFVQNKRIIKDTLFPTPELFTLLQKESHTGWKEMYVVFNMGHRMEIYLPERFARDIIDIASNFNIDAKIVGNVEDAVQNELIIKDINGEYRY